MALKLLVFNKPNEKNISLIIPTFMKVVILSSYTGDFIDRNKLKLRSNNKS